MHLLTAVPAVETPHSKMALQACCPPTALLMGTILAPERRPGAPTEQGEAES